MTQNKIDTTVHLSQNHSISSALPLQNTVAFAIRFVRRHDMAATSLYFGTMFVLVLLPFVRMPFALFEILSAAGYCLILSIALSRSWEETWWQRQNSPFRRGTNDTKSFYARRLLNEIARHPFINRTVDWCLLIFLTSQASRMVYDWYTAGGIWWHLCLSFAMGAIPPGLALIALRASRRSMDKTAGGPRSDSAKHPSKRFAANDFLTERWNRFSAQRLGYLGAYCGCLSFVFYLFCGDNGVGAQIAGWLQSSMCAARIVKSSSAATPFIAVVSVVLAMLLCAVASSLMVRVSAAFQVFANRLFIHRDSILDAMFETAVLKRYAVAIPERNIGAKNIVAILKWLASCYITLFALVAFCPPPLSDAINGWLAASMESAHIQVALVNSLNFRIFLASIIAGYGAVPLAVMSCTFLFTRKTRFLIVSSQGILCPPSTSFAWHLSPLKTWDSLKNVSLKKVQGTEGDVLTLHFSFLDKIDLELSKMNKAHLHELLAAADEYGSNVHFAQEVIELRSNLTLESKASSVVNSNKYSSTTFSPRKCGDYLNSGKYRVIRKLASKSLSAVYLARDLKNQRVVIKEFVLPDAARQKAQIIANFDRECKILLNLRHASIAGVIDVFRENDSRCMVFEFVSGANLRTIVERKGPRNEKIVRHRAAEIARVMQYLHAQQAPVLHRDLTPDNLMEDLEGNLKLIDFGAAHQFVEGVTGTLIGKQCYIAPEQLRGKPGLASDIYSFGCTLYFLVTGSDPSALQRADLSSCPHISAELKQLIERCTEFEEHSRYQSFDQVIAILEGHPLDDELLEQAPYLH